MRQCVGQTTAGYTMTHVHTHEFRCDSCAVRHRAVCGALDREEIVRLSNIARHKDLPPGHLIFSDDERPSYFANIIGGVVKLSKTLGDGRQQIVGLQFASDFLGRPYRDRVPYFAETVTPVKLCTYERGQFEQLVREMPGFGQRLFENTLDELDAARDWMLLLGRKTAEEKVASFLLMVAKRMKLVGCSKGDPTIRFELPLTRSEIADHLGLTIETVSRQFTRLKSQKIIGLEGGRTIVVPNFHRLENAAEAMS
jgi:CRP/FNR family transcriptional regulator